MKIRRTTAFTLVELLVVIAIVGIFAAILIPVLAHARAAARDSQCKAALRSLGMATQLFIGDNRGRLPVAAGDRTTGPGFWYVQLAAYLSPAVANPAKTAQAKENLVIGELTVCPCAFQDRGSYVKGIGVAYGWNYAPGTAIYDGAAYASIPSPARTIFLGERWGKNTANTMDSDSLVWPPWKITPLNTDDTLAGSNPSTLRVSHGGHSNYLFFDGHVGSYRPEETYNVANPSAAPNLWRGL